jgi:hypothetical protein
MGTNINRIFPISKLFIGYFLIIFMLDRLKEYIDFKGISVAGFERSIGMSNASFGKSLKNGGTIGADKLEIILRIYSDLNLTWLVTGKGKMIKENAFSDERIDTLNDNSPPYKIEEQYITIIQTQKETIDTQKRYIFRLEDEIETLKKRVQETQPGEVGQKRKAG